jgi:lantibiotic modifying enzyme
MIAPFISKLEEGTHRLQGLGASERDVVLTSGATALRNTVHAKMSRLLLLELHAAALTGAITQTDKRKRWEEFIELACTSQFNEHLRGRYPRLHQRIATVAQSQINAVLTLAERVAADRNALGELTGRGVGDLRSLSLGVGDTHRSGQTVARLDFAEGSAMYKPRSLGVDMAMDALLARILPPGPAEERIRVPRVLARAGYGFTEFIEHRYCQNDSELKCFYRNLGYWLAVMRLVGGTDLHSENVIAHGPVPVVVDVETVFTPKLPANPSGMGHAFDIAAEAVRGTVLRTGLLPIRMDVNAAGVDMSAAGALQGQQPPVLRPKILEGGTGAARIGLEEVNLTQGPNHPSPTPVLHRYWDQVCEGFADLSHRLRQLDAAGGQVTGLLKLFAGCHVRLVRRNTQAYVEIMRMLWHPASLHDEAAARARAQDVLERNARTNPGAPMEGEVIAREIEELLVGDVPVFTANVDDAMIQAVANDWRSADQALEERTVHGALVGAYLNEWVFPTRPRASYTVRIDGLDARRRKLAASLIEQLRHRAIRGDDGTVTWISPVLTEYGWSIRSLTPDVYSGQGGVAIALAEYIHEARHGRADELSGLMDTLSGTLDVLRATEDGLPTHRLGGFLGVASQVWTWSTLYDLLGDPQMLERARSRADVLEKRVGEDTRVLELLDGLAGVIVPLLNLAEQTREDRWLVVAAQAGRVLHRCARHEEAWARWPTETFPNAVGGMAHGATGIGWALARLGLSNAGTSTDRPRWLDVAERAFAFQNSLYRAEEANWADIRFSEIAFHTSWCNGSAGIGLAAGDIYARTGELSYLEMLRRAWPATVNKGFGWSHTLCHGDLGTWEMLELARAIDPRYDGLDRDSASSEILSGLEEHGPLGGLAREAFSPGLMSGLGGVIHSLLRMHPENPLCSPLLLSRYTAKAP